jgi:hypothetical protein
MGEGIIEFSRFCFYEGRVVMVTQCGRFMSIVFIKIFRTLRRTIGIVVIILEIGSRYGRNRIA